MVASKTDMLELGRKQAKLFLDNNVAYCEILVVATCPREILRIAYHTLLRQGKLSPIEDLLQQEKETAWATAKDIARGRLGRKALVEVVQALLVIEYFLTLTEN
jgi:hypothetical protein